MVDLIGEEAMNAVVSHLPEVIEGVHREAEGVGAAAEAGLEAARSSTHWTKIYPDISPPHLTSIDVEQGSAKHTQDAFVNLNALNPMALEFGHSPSGVFGPDGKYGHVKTKSPEGLYILHKAAGFGLE